jgi:hypothetical protein
MTDEETTMRALRLPAALGFAFVVYATPPAEAAPCVGFVDVDDSVPAQAAFCPSVEWIKNRSVTTGCSIPNSYCPNDPVSRLAMAAFMNRLGNALTPTTIRVDTAPGAVDLDASAVVCQTADLAIGGYPRQAVVDLTFSAQAPGDVDVAADLVKSTDGGANWTVLTAVGNRGWIPTGRWGTLANLATTDLAVNDNVRFGVRVTRASGAVDLSDSRCNLRVAIGSRTGAISPF